MARGKRAYEVGGINTEQLAGDPLEGYQWQPPPRGDAGGMGNMLSFINSMYGQVQQGRQNQLQNALEAAKLQSLVESERDKMQLMKEQEARESLNAQLERTLKEQAGTRAEKEFAQLPEREKAQRQFELNKASIGVLPSLSDATRGPLRLLNPDYAAREDAQRALERERQLRTTRMAIKDLSPKKKKEIISSVTDPDLRTQLLSELEQGDNKGGSPAAAERPSPLQQLGSQQGMPIPYPDIGRIVKAVLPTAPMITVDPELRRARPSFEYLGGGPTAMPPQINEPGFLEWLQKRSGG